MDVLTQRFCRLLGILLGLTALPGQLRADHARDTLALKVTFIRSFIEFVQWPTPPDQLLVCSFGKDGLDEMFDHLNGYPVPGSTLITRRHVTLATLADCHAIYLPDIEKAHLGSILDAVRRKPVLVIADFPAGAQLGATLSLYKEGNRLAFDTNLAAATQGGLQLRSRLLQLARRVF